MILGLQIDKLVLLFLHLFPLSFEVVLWDFFGLSNPILNHLFGYPRRLRFSSNALIQGNVLLLLLRAHQGMGSSLVG